MKKITVFIIIFMLMLSMQTAFAEEALPESEGRIFLELPVPEPLEKEDSFGTSIDLWNYWQNERAMNYDDPNPYPEYITGVWTDDDMATLTFGVTEDEPGEQGKAELLALIENDDTVKFAYQTYPYNELWQIQLKLQEKMGEETGVFGIGIYEMENHLHIDIDKNNKNSEKFMKECFAEYGDRIVFEQSDGISVTAEEMGHTDAAGGTNQRIWIAVAVPVVMGLIGIIVKRKQRKQDKQN